MLRVSVSDLESWRYWRGGGQPVDGLVRRLLRLDPQTPAMLLGIAFEDWLMAGASTDEFEFQVEAVLPKPHAVQVSLEAVYHLPGPFVVHLAGRADAIVGGNNRGLENHVQSHPVLQVRRLFPVALLPGNVRL